MATRLFSRNRIRGISFHKTRGSVSARVPQLRFDKNAGSSLDLLSMHSPSDSFWTGPTLEQIRDTAPTPLSRSDLLRLLGDHARNEIHTLVSEAIEQLTRLRHLTQSVDRFAPRADPQRRFLHEDKDAATEAHPLFETAIELQRIQRLWKLRLEVLEMITMAQSSLRI